MGEGESPAGGPSPAPVSIAGDGVDIVPGAPGAGVKDHFGSPVQRLLSALQLQSRIFDAGLFFASFSDCDRNAGGELQIVLTIGRLVSEICHHVVEPHGCDLQTVGNAERRSATGLHSKGVWRSRDNVVRGEASRRMRRADQHFAEGFKTGLLEPNFSALYYGVCVEKMKSGLPDEAKQVCDSGIAHGMDADAIHLALLKLAVLRHDATLYSQQAAWAEQHHSSVVLAGEVQGDLTEGRVRDALQHLAQACALLGPNGDAVCNQYRFGVASDLGYLNEIDRARQLIGRHTPDPSDENGLSALAQTGDLRDAEEGLKAQEAANPRSPAWEGKVGSLVRANLLLAQNHPEKVAAALEVARPFEWSGLDTWYLRALGYEESGQYDKAEAEFRRMLAHPEIDVVNTELPLAQLGIARCYTSCERSPPGLRGFFPGVVSCRSGSGIAGESTGGIL